MEGSRSLAELFLRRVIASGTRDAFLFPVEHEWARYTWAQAGELVRAIACGLRSLDVGLEDRCALLAATRIDWILADLGIMCAGGATTTLYPSNTADECAYILNDSEACVAFVENEVQQAKLQRRRGELPHLRHVILFDGAAAGDASAMTLTQLMEAGRAWDRAHPGAYDARIAAIEPHHLATLLYTSGTTGQQKGVELTHDCWLYEAEAIEALDLLRPDDVQYLWLPLSHSFGKVLESAQVHIGFTSAVDGRVDRLVENLPAIRPTFVAAVPRVFEKIRNKVMATARESGRLKRRIVDWAFEVGRQVSDLRQAGREPAGWLALQNALADRLVFAKLRARFGDRLRFFISGSAPLAPAVSRFFHAANVLILEGYGLTETSAASFVNRPEWFKFGTVGPALPGTDVMIASSDGEILIRGRGVMRGYHRLPDATREAIDGEGWLRTGDIGSVDADGFLTIADRKKDLIKTSSGKYVAPQAVEGRIKTLCPYVNQVLVHGNARHFCSALMTIDEDALRKRLRNRGGAEQRAEQLVRDPRVLALVQECLDAVNATLASHETIKKFALLPADFSVDDGELTASLKMKRRVVEQKYRAVLDTLYEE
jgi:long-chain acyl-CoA synthetase